MKNACSLRSQWHQDKRRRGTLKIAFSRSQKAIYPLGPLFPWSLRGICFAFCFPLPLRKPRMADGTYLHVFDFGFLGLNRVDIPACMDACELLPAF